MEYFEKIGEEKVFDGDEDAQYDFQV